MIDPVLERNYADCQELLERWKQFHDYLASSVKGDAPTAEREAVFLEVKSAIAILHDSFMAVLQADKNIGQSVLTIVSRAITLHHLARMSVAEIKKMEIEWHQAFLLLQETLGNLEDKRDKLADISEAAYRAEQMRLKTKQRIDHILKSNVFIGAVIFIVLLFVTVGVQVLGLWDWSNFRNYRVTQRVFYAVYDRGVRFAFPHAKYYRLLWVDWAITPEEARGFLPGDYWIHDPTSLTTPDRSSTHESTRFLQSSGVPQNLIQQLNAATEKSQIWAFNSRDYICFGMYLMASTSEASRLAEDIRNSLASTPAGEAIGTTNRANILIVVQCLPKETNRQPDPESISAFSEFVQRGGDLIW